MPKVELYINDQLCDLTGGEEINVDYTIFDISKIDVRGGARSYEFEIPKTNRNKKVLESPEIVNNLSNVPYTRLRALVLVDGVDVLVRFCELQSVKGFYRVRLYGGNTNFYSIVADKTLYDLDLTRFDHVWTLDNVYASRTNTEGYIYSIIDYHEDSPNSYINNDNKEMRIDFMPPAFFVNTIINQILSESGYTLINELESDSENLLLTLNSNSVDNNDYVQEKYQAIFGIGSRMEVPTYPLYTPSPVNAFGFETISGYSGNYYNIPYQVPGLGYPSLRLEDRISFRMTVSLDVTFLTSNNFISIIFRRFDYAGNIMPGGQQFDYQDYSAGTQTITLTFDDVLNFGQVQREYYYSIFIVNNGNYVGDSSSVFIESTSTVTISEVVYFGNLLLYNNFIPISGVLPKLTQYQFLKNYFLLFNAIPLIDEINKTVTIKKFSSILANIGSAIDWSNKIDLSEEHQIKFLLNEYAQNNILRYKDDSDDFIPAEANGVIEIGNKNLEPEKVLVELDFSSTNMVKRLNNSGVGNNIVPQIGVYKNGVWENQKNARLLQLSRKSDTDIGGAVTYHSPDDSISFSDSIPFSYFIDLRESFNLGFGNNIIANYYAELAAIIQNLKVVTVYLRLSAADISQLDFTRPVYIAKFEAYFYISSIKGFSYTSNESTMVELVKLNING